MSTPSETQEGHAALDLRCLCPACATVAKAERDRLRAVLVGVVGTDDPEWLGLLIANIDHTVYVDGEALSAAARVLLEVRP